jgi:hypothetical protein
MLPALPPIQRSAVLNISRWFLLTWLTETAGAIADSAPTSHDGGGARTHSVRLRA